MFKPKFDASTPFKSIGKSVFYCFALLIIITLFIFYIISIRYTEKAIMNNSIHYKTKLARQINRDIDSYIFNMESISDMVVQGGDVQKYLFDDLSTVEKARLYNNIMTQYNTVLNSRQDISNIGVVTTDLKFIINEGEDTLNGNVELMDIDWYAQAINGYETNLTASHVQHMIYNNYKWVVTLSKGIMNPVTGKNEGVFFIDLNYKVLKDLCESSNLASGSYMFIIDEKGKIIYHPKQQLLYSGLAVEEIGQVLGCKSNYFITGTGAESKLYTVSESEKTGWRVVGVASLSNLMKEKEEAQRMFMLSAAILLLVAIVLSFFIAKFVTRPVTEKMDELTQDLRSDNQKVLVMQEVEYARTYLRIQRMHYKNKQDYTGRLEYEINVDPDIGQEPVINLILQPLVENAVVHGIRNIEYTRVIRIIGYAEDNNIILKVIDNGVGMDEETLENIFDISKANEDYDIIGLYGVQTRIQQYYGEKYGLHIESTPEKGTTVTLTIPKGFKGEVHNEKI